MYTPEWVTKIFITIACGFIFALFFTQAFIARADLTSATSTYNLPVDVPIYAVNVAYNVGSRYVGFAYASTSEWGIQSYSFQGCKTTGTTYDLYGYIYDLKNNVILATSTSPITFTATCNTYATTTVTFDSYAITDNNWYAIVVGRVGGAYSGTNYWKMKTYGNGNLSYQKFVNIAFGDYITQSGFFNFGGLPVFYVSDDTNIFSCTSGESSSTIECDMASTTEAIYTTGYSNALLLGFFLFLLFFYIGYRFGFKFL